MSAQPNVATPVIREMTMADYDSVLELWRQTPWIGLSQADERPALAAYLARNPGTSFVALAGGRVAGAILAGHDGRRGLIHHLAVAEDRRRQGLGRALVDKCLAALANQGLGKCHLFVFTENQAGREFWESLGFGVRDDLRLMSSRLD